MVAGGREWALQGYLENIQWVIDVNFQQLHP